MPPRDVVPGGKRAESKARTLAGRAAGILFATAVAALACEALYLVVMNVFLSTPLFEAVVNATPDVVDVHYARGWSLFPTRVHAQGLSIRATDSHVEWILRFDEVVFDCSLLDLARKKEFHVTRARGSGITFRARLKVASPAATREHLRDLPPIDSLGTVALIPSEPPSAGEWNDEAWHLWTVRIDDADAEHVHEVWIEGARLEGDARVTGGFYLKPMRAAEVGPAHVEVRRGSVTLGGRTVAEPLLASADFELDRFDPRVSTGIDILHHVSLSADARGTVPDLDNLFLALPDSGQIRGSLEVSRAAIRMAKGVLQDGTRVDAHGARVLVTDAAHAISGSMDMTARIVQARLEASATLEHVDADFVLSVPRATVSADSAALDLGSPFADLHAVIDVPEAELARAGNLAGYLPKPSPVRISGGALRGSLRAEVWRASERARGDLTVRASDLDVTVGKIRMGGDAVADVAVRSFDLRRSLADVEGSRVALRNVRVTGASTDATAWSGDVLLGVSSLGLSPAPRFEGNVALRARDASPVLALLFRDTLPKFLAPLTDMPSLTASSHVVLQPDNIVVSDLLASGGELALRGTYAAHARDQRAAFVVTKGLLSFGINLDNDGPHVRLFGLDQWYADLSRQALGLP